MATGKRIKDPTITQQTTFVPSYRVLVDKMDTGSGDWLQARNMELGLIGNTYFQGSTNGVNWHDEITALDTYIRFTTDGGVTWKDLDTDEIREGIVNLYYTEARVSANTDVAANTAAKHTHANKTLLDTLTDGGGGTLFLSDAGSYLNPLSGREALKAITVELPTSSEDIAMFYVEQDITITNIHAVVAGSATPSVTINPVQTTDRSAAGTAILSSPTAITNTTTGQNLTSFNDATVPAGSWVVFKTTAQSGTVDEISMTVVYTID